MKSLRLFVVTIFIFAFNAIAITGDLSELMSTYSGEMNTARQALPNPNQLTGYQRYLFAFDTRGKDADQKIARLLVVVQEQEKLVKYYINEKSANDLFDVMPANERIVDVGLAVLKAKIKLSCNFCESAADWSEYRKTVDAYFDFFDVKDAHGGFSGLPFAKFMETKFYDAEFQTHVIELFKRLQAISDSFKDKSYSLDTNIYKLALDVTGGDKSKSIELLGLMTSRDVLITRYLKYLRVSNPEFMHAFALTPVYARLITELDRKQSGTADDRFSYDGKAKTSDNRAYYFWSAALASKKLIEMGYGEKYVQRVSLEFPRQYKVIRYFEARGFLRDEKWKANFISGSFQAMRISGNGQRVGKHAVSDSELELPEKVNAYLNSLNIGRSVENFYKKEWLSSALHDGLLDGKAAILFYDFASSKVGFSHVKLIVGGRAFEIHRFKNSDGTYLRERDLMDSLLDSKPGVLPSGILEFNVDSEQAKDVLGHLSKASDSAMKYSFFNKMFNKDAFNCAGVIYDSLKKSGVPLPELARLDVTASQIFQRMVTGIPNARLLGKDGKWINNLVVPNLSRASFFGSTVKVNSDLKYAVGVETLKAEQGLSATTPLLSNLRNMLGVFVKNFSSNGNLDEVYIPKNANTLEITSVLLTPEQAGQVVSVKDASMIPNDLAFPLVDGKRWVRFFIHPATVAHFRTLIETAKVDPVKWIGTPSASARSLYIQDQQGKVSVFMIKTSLVERMGGSSRIINEERITRAVRVSEIVNGIHKASGGVLPSGKTWEFMSEPVSVLPTGSPAGGYILRTLPQNTNQTIMLPVFSLISRRDANEPWIEELFRYSGYKSKKEFVLNEFVLPLVDLHILFSIQNGLTTEFHQQNVMIKVNKDTRKIEGLVIKDMDSHFIDQSLRKNALGISTNDLPITQEMSYLFRFKMAQDNQIKSYMDIMRTRSFEWVLKYVLNSKDLESVLREADTRYLTAFNHQFPEFSVSRMSEVKTAWDRVHQKYTTADEADVYRRMNEADTKKNRGFIIESIDKVQSKLSERRFSNVPVARLSCAHFYLSF